MKTPNETISVNEKFKAVDVKTVDSKNRLNLGEKVMKNLSRTDAFEIFIGNDGDVLLRPVVNIPSREAWIFQNPEALKQLRQGLIEAQQGKIEKVKDLDEFLENL